MEKNNELIIVSENALSKLKDCATYSLENAYSIISNKDIKDKLANELITRKDLKVFKVVRSCGKTKKEIEATPNEAFINYFLNMCLTREINLIDYLDIEKIKEQVGTTFSASYFNVKVIEKTKEQKIYLKKADK